MYKIANYGTPLAREARPNILANISPAHKKLTMLDSWQKEANYQLKQHIISVEKYNDTLNCINLARSKALIALEKEEGTFKSDAQKAREGKLLQKQIDENIAYEQLSANIKQARNKQTSNTIFEVICLFLVLVSVILASQSAAISCLLAVFIYFKYFNKSTR